jgi:hypothetical protein
MAIVQNTLIGRSRRSVGGVTFSTWKGLNVAKSKPVSVANPKSPKQIMRRSILTQLVALFRMVPNGVDNGFRSLAIHMSPYNAFVGANAKNGFATDAPPAAAILYGNLVFAKGTIAPTAIVSAVASVAGASTIIDWDGSLLGVGQSVTDKANIVLINSTKGNAHSVTNDAVRTAGTMFVPEEDFAYSLGDVIRVYLFFTSTTNSSVSDSVYLNIAAGV